MEVVLRADVEKLGLRGEVVSVARGYARNYLLPRGLAEPVTPGLVRELERRESERARHEAKSVDEARAIANRLQAKELRFDVNAGPTGSLFGSITPTNVADRLWETQKVRVDRRKLAMDAIKRVGRYTVLLELFPEVVAELRLVVAPEGQEPPEETPAAEAAAEAPPGAEAAADSVATDGAAATAATEEPAAVEPGAAAEAEASAAGAEPAPAE